MSKLVSKTLADIRMTAKADTPASQPDSKIDFPASRRSKKASGKMLFAALLPAREATVNGSLGR